MIEFGNLNDLNEVRFFVAGDPVAKGSTRAFYVKTLNRVVTTDADPKTKGWQSQIAYMAALKQQESNFYTNERYGYEVKAEFTFSRPVSLPKKHGLKVTRPDLDKLVRTVLDALSEVLMPDDAQVIEIQTAKRYGAPPGVMVSVRRVKDGR